MQSDHDYEVPAASTKHSSKAVLAELLADDDDGSSDAFSSPETTVSEEMSQYLHETLLSRDDVSSAVVENESTAISDALETCQQFLQAASIGVASYGALFWGTWHVPPWSLATYMVQFGNFYLM